MRTFRRLAAGLLASREGTIVVLLVLLVGAFGALNRNFYNPENVQAIIRSTAYIGVVAVGMGLCLISGTIDLSVGASAGMAGIIMAQMVVNMNIPWYIAVPTGMLSGALIGVINWLLTEHAKIVAFVATLSTMYIARGVAVVVSNAYSIYPLPNWMSVVANASPLGTSVIFLVFIALVVIFEIILKNTLWGLQVRAVGSDKEVATCTEVDVKRITLSVSILAGVLATISGIFLAGKLVAAQPYAGVGWELMAITACAIGGVSLFGYDGSMIGVFLGVLAMQIIVNGMVVIGLSPYMQQGVTGVILLISMAIDMYRRNKMILLEKVKYER